MQAGYSGKSLAEKLGVKSDPVVLNAPSDYAATLGQPFRTEPGGDEAFIQVFLKTNGELEDSLNRAIPCLRKDGQLWVSWPKLSSKLSLGLREDDIRNAAIARGLVDVKVCAVDADWSGLKLVYRKENR